MATQVTNYQCPACTGPLQFSAATGKLECEYCGSSFETQEVEALFAEKEAKAAEALEKEIPLEEETPWDTDSLNSDWGEDGDHMRAYNCPSCGAQLICDETTAATACPYCGNPTVVPGQFSGALRPDYVIPFRVDKKTAQEALKKHYKGKVLLPNTFKSQHTIEKIQGIYVPFWLYDGVVSGNFRFHGTRTHRHRRGDVEITEINHFNLHRSGSLEFHKVPVDASSKMPDAHMDSIEPFDYADLKPFSTAYLPGFLADKYDVSVEESNQRADQRCIDTLEATMMGTVMGYEGCHVVSRNVSMKRGKVQYAMLPVWMLNVKWQGQTYLFAINGQTGKVAGDLPVSKAKALAVFAAVAAPLSLLSTLVALLLT